MSISKKSKIDIQIPAGSMNRHTDPCDKKRPFRIPQHVIEKNTTRKELSRLLISADAPLSIIRGNNHYTELSTVGSFNDTPKQRNKKCTTKCCQAEGDFAEICNHWFQKNMIWNSFPLGPCYSCQSQLVNARNIIERSHTGWSISTEMGGWKFVSE